MKSLRNTAMWAVLAAGVLMTAGTPKAKAMDAGTVVTATADAVDIFLWLGDIKGESNDPPPPPPPPAKK